MHHKQGPDDCRSVAIITGGPNAAGVMASRSSPVAPTAALSALADLCDNEPNVRHEHRLHGLQLETLLQIFPFHLRSLSRPGSVLSKIAKLGVGIESVPSVPATPLVPDRYPLDLHR